MSRTGSVRATLGSWADALVVLGERRRMLTAIVAGALTAGALPPFDIWFIPFVTVPIFLFLLDGAQGRRGPGLWPAFRTGWAFGFGYHVAGLWWIGSAFLVEAEEFAWLLPLAVLVLPAGLSLFHGLGAAIAFRLGSSGWTRVLALAFAWGATEWLRGHLLTGFPWNLHGATATPGLLTMQPTALWGAYAFTFMAILAQGLPALTVPGHGRRRDGLFAVLVLLVVAGHAGWSFLRVSDTLDPDGTPVRIVQPAVPQAEKWEPENAARIFQTLLDLSAAETSPASPGLQPGTLLVWPESVFPFLVLREAAALAAIAELVPEGSVLVTGAMRQDETPEGPRTYNAVLAFQDDGSVLAIQDKTHLVPFGEYLPLQPQLEAIGLRQLTNLRGGFTAGRARLALDLASAMPGLPPFVPLVCYEIIFPGGVVPPSVRGSADRPGFLLNLTNDSWFGATPGPYQHARQARMRGIENGIPVLRAANDGISFVSDAHGRVIASLARHQRGTLDAVLPSAVARAPYAVWGDLPFGLMLLMAYAILLWSGRSTQA